MIHGLIGLRDERETAVAAMERGALVGCVELEGADGDDEKCGGGHQADGERAAERITGSATDGQAQERIATADEGRSDLSAEAMPQVSEERGEDEEAGGEKMRRLGLSSVRPKPGEGDADGSEQ